MTLQNQKWEELETIKPKNPFSSRKPISITIFTRQRLVRHNLKLLLEFKSELRVLSFAETKEELLQKISEDAPDVILFCPVDKKEALEMEVLPEIFKASPETKAVLLATGREDPDHLRALDLGTTGIVGAHQNEQALIRAIRNVANGEVYFNQKLMNSLLAKGDSSSNGKNGNGNSSIGFHNDPLTKREIEVVKAVASGRTTNEIARALFISKATLRHHLSSIYSKLHLKDRLNLVIYAYQHKILDNDDEDADET